MACLAGPAAARCEARSGPNTAALVELYTSVGCSSCPPAERWLSSLAGRASVIPLALYVDYRAYSGSRDNDVRRKFTPLQRMALVYTPQVLLQGRDFRGWGTAAFDEAVKRLNAHPARARLWLQVDRADPYAFEVVARAELLEPSRHAALYLAAYRTLMHDNVVLEWQGPLYLPSGLQLEQRRRLPLLPGAVPANSGVAAFIQDRRSAEVLQALLLPACFS
jgi:hypothetical protein